MRPPSQWRLDRSWPLRFALIWFGIELGLRMMSWSYRLAFLDRMALPPDRIDARAFRVLCVGESTTFGDGVPDQAQDSYPTQLERLLRSRYPEIRITVYNRGVCAISAADIYAHLPRNIKEIRPQLVVIQAGHNINGLTAASPWTWLSPRIADSFISIRAVSLLYRVVRLGLRGKLVVDRLYSDAYLRAQPDALAAMDDRTLIQYIERMIITARDSGGRVILCGYIDSPSGNERLRAAAEHLAVPFCDTERAARDYQARHPGARLISADGWHPNRLGYSVMADALLRTIADQDLIRSALSANGRISRPNVGTSSR